MKRKSIKRVIMMTSLFSLMILSISILYTKSNKALILRNNIEAISDSNGNDPEGGIHINLCFTNIKWQRYAETFKCEDGTTTFKWNDTPGIIIDVFPALHPSFDICPCSKQEDYACKLFSRWGYCYDL